MLKYFVTITATVILLSCTMVTSIPLGESSLGKVPVYTKTSIDFEYNEIAIITAKFDSELGAMDDTEAMEKVYKEANIIGADALIFKGSDSNSLLFTAIRFK